MKKLSGTLVQRGGIWHVLVRPGGKPHYITLDTDVRAEAVGAQKSAVREYLAGLAKPISKKNPTLKVLGVTMKELATDYYKKREALGRKTWKDEQRWWKLWAEPHLGELPPKSINTGLIEDVLLKASEKRAHRSLNHIREQIRRLLLEARKLGHLPQDFPVRDMIADVTVPDGQGVEKQRETLEDWEFSQYVSHPDTYEYSEVENAKRKAAGNLSLSLVRSKSWRSSPVPLVAVARRCTSSTGRTTTA